MKNIITVFKNASELSGRNDKINLMIMWEYGSAWDNLPEKPSLFSIVFFKRQSCWALSGEIWKKILEIQGIFDFHILDFLERPL